MRTLIFTAAFVGLFAAHAFGDEKFFAMDTDKSNQLSWQEFTAAYPNMKRAAFDNIDKNADGSISHEEWDMFQASHGNRKDMGMPGKEAEPRETGKDAEVPLIRPPK